MILNSDNYFSSEANNKYMSVSLFKAFNKCQSAALASLRGEYVKEYTAALLMGSYVDAHFEGTLDVFRAKHPELYKRDGSLKTEYAKCEYIIERIESQPLMVELLGGEKQKIMTGSIAGVDVKIKVDSLLPDMIVDLKVMRDFMPIYVEEQGRLPWYEAWRYDLQGAVYQEIVRQNIGKKLPFVLVAATKEDEPDLCAIEISQELLDYELGKFKEHVPVYDAIKAGIMEPKRCEMCDFCRKTKIIKEITKTGGMTNE